MIGNKKSVAINQSNYLTDQRKSTFAVWGYAVLMNFYLVFIKHAFSNLP